MKEPEEQTPHSNWIRRLRSLLTSFSPVTGAAASPEVQPGRGKNGTAQPGPPSALKIAGYSLVLMGPDGEVVWTREWDSGGVFEFRSRQRLLVYCGFTNHSTSETEISEYEIELVDEDGAVVERFSDSFGDSVIVPPGESKHFPAEWRM
jgi:hypothetical protein